MTKSKSGFTLNQSEYGALVEALRRRTRFFHDPTGGTSIRDQWTGVGTLSEYKAAEDAQLMMRATSATPRAMSWWKLTEKGARVVCYWLGQGFTFEKIENGPLPSPTVPAEVML